MRVYNDSEYLRPKEVYDFVAGSTDGVGATLGGASLSGGAVDNGNNRYAGVTGDIAGLKLEMPNNVSSATIYYGESFLSKLTSYLDDVTSQVGTLAKALLRPIHLYQNITKK